MFNFEILKNFDSIKNIQFCGGGGVYTLFSEDNLLCLRRIECHGHGRWTHTSTWPDPKRNTVKIVYQASIYMTRG